MLLMEFDTLADFMYTVCVHMASCIVHQQYWNIAISTLPRRQRATSKTVFNNMKF